MESYKMATDLAPGKTLSKFSISAVIGNPNGEVRKYLTGGIKETKFYQEVYFSRLLPGKSKKWKCNKKQSQNLTVASGRVSIICIQECINGFVYEEFLIDENENFGVLEIPAGVIYGLFTDAKGALIVNALENPYSEGDAHSITRDFDLTPKLF